MPDDLDKYSSVLICVLVLDFEYIFICLKENKKKYEFVIKINSFGEELQDGRRVRRGDQLLPHKSSEMHLHVEQLLQNTY